MFILELSTEKMTSLFYACMILFGIGLLLKTIVSFLPQQKEEDKLAATIILVFRYLFLFAALAVCLYMMFSLEQ